MIKQRGLAAGIARAFGGVDGHRSACRAALMQALSLGGWLACAASAHAAFYVVDTTGDPGPPGSTSLREAVVAASASAGNVVKFDASLVGSTITLRQGAIHTRSANDFSIQGRGSGAITISADAASGIFDFSSPATTLNPQRPTVTLSGVNLVRGVANNGAGIYAFATNLALDDVSISGCSSVTGGAIGIWGGSLTLVGSKITGNTASNNGGAIHAKYLWRQPYNQPAIAMKISRSTISGNRAAHGGGAIYADSIGSLSIYDSTLSGNTTYGYGAGLFVGLSYGSVRIERSLVSGNASLPPRGPDDVQGGGGIALISVSGQTLIRNSTITGNTAYSGAGGGVGIFDSGSANRALIDFSTISDNYAGYGFSGNGVFTAGTSQISNSIIAANANRGNGIDLSPGTFLAHHSLIQNPGSATISGSGNLLGRDPLLGPLRDNGGPTRSQLPAPTSPVIDKADPASAVATDQRGYARPAGIGKDMGAAERQLPEDVIFRNGLDSS